MDMWLHHIKSLIQLTEAEWRIDTSVNQVIVGSYDGLSPKRHRANTWTNADALPIGS